MQLNNAMGLREYLQQLDTKELDAMLQRELEKPTPDVEAVRLMVRLLEERDAALPSAITPGEEAAWQRYQERMGIRPKRKVPLRRYLAVAASLVLVVGILFAVVPQQAGAETFWQMLQRWTGTLLEILNPKEHISSLDYQFETDNPGLQQVYEAAVELGIPYPMVPAWLPDGCELIDQNIIDTPLSQSVSVWFSLGDEWIVFSVDLYKGEPAHQYYKDNTHYEEYERNGITFHITRNNEKWVAIWATEKIEYFLTLDCQEETLRRILESIYVTEDG